MTPVYPFYLMPTPEAVMREWRTPVKNLPAPAWLYFSELTKCWRLCHGPAEASWRVARGEMVQLIDEQPTTVDAGGFWIGLRL